MFKLIVKLVHDLGVHLLDLLLKLLDFSLDGKNFFFELFKFEFVDVLNFFHLICGFEVLDDQCLLVFDDLLFLLELFDQMHFFVIILDNITAQLLDLVVGLDNEVLKVDQPLLVSINFLFSFSDF